MKANMNTRTIQITMFWCTLCPNLRTVVDVGLDKTIFTCKGEPSCKIIPSPINGGGPEIPNWCPLSEDKVNRF
jgi:hypothetical protein